jgi:hypothetical protein
MTWEVSIPFQSRSQEIGEVLALDRYVEDPQERLIVSHLLIESAFEGVHTVDDLLRLAPERKRALLDRARVAAGLKTIKEEELQLAKEAQFRASAAMPFTDEEGRRLQTCSASGCKAFPTDEVGAWRPVADRKFWCDLHRDQAGPDDDRPPEPATSSITTSARCRSVRRPSVCARRRRSVRKLSARKRKRGRLRPSDCGGSRSIAAPMSHPRPSSLPGSDGERCRP